MAASLSGALKSAIALGGANLDPLSGNGDPIIVYVPQPKLVEQLGWDEPDIKVAKRGNFDDGTSIWGDPIESMSVSVKKWTNGTKAALTNSTNTILQQQPSIVQKPVSTNVQNSGSTTSASPMMLNDENWPKQHSPTLPQQSTSQWNDTPALAEQRTPPPLPPPQSQQQANYRTQQSAPANWNSQSQQQGHHGDDWFRDGMVDTSDWGLQVNFQQTNLFFLFIIILFIFSSRVHKIKLHSIHMKAKLIRVVGVHQEDLVVVWVDHYQWQQ